MKDFRAWLIDLNDGGLAVLYSLIIYGALFTIMGVASGMGGDISRAERVVAWVLPPCLGMAAVLTQRWTGAAWARLLGAGGGPARDAPPLSKVRSLVQREQWDDAIRELRALWARYPGHGDVLAAFERCYLDGLRAPSGFADFLQAALPVLRGEDRAYAYLRLAELNVDVLGRPPDARLWCRRLETEFPSSGHRVQARALLDRLPATAGP